MEGYRHGEEGIKMRTQPGGHQAPETILLTLLSSLCIAWIRPSSSCADRDTTVVRGRRVPSWELVPIQFQPVLTPAGMPAQPCFLNSTPAIRAPKGTQW